MWGDMKKRCIQFVVKSAIGRFIKEVSKRHLSDPKVSWEGLGFELNNLEVNEEAVNREIALSYGGIDGDEPPIRLANGFVGCMRGEVLWTLTQPRNVQVDGIDLTFDVVGHLQPKTAGHDGSIHKGKPSEGDRSAPLYSSLLAGEVTEEILQREVLKQGGGPPTTGEGDEEGATINDGVNVLSQVIKSLVHNTCGEMLEITLRFRVPPPGSEIVPGQPLPEGTNELLLYMPKITVLDETDAQRSVGNSFRKRITTTGWIVQLTPAEFSTARTNVVVTPNTAAEGSLDDAQQNSVQRFPSAEGEIEDQQQAQQRLDMKYTIFSGDINSEKNEVIIQYFDVGPETGTNATRWRTEVSLGDVHCLLTPPQLMRLMRSMSVLTRAPEAQEQPNGDGQPGDGGDLEDTGVAGSQYSQPVSTTHIVKFDCDAVHCALLHSDTEGEIGRCWRMLHRGQELYGSLQTPHYSLSVERFVLITSTPVDLKYIDPDDSLLPVFRQYGGQYLTIGVRNFSVYEKQLNGPRAALVKLTNPSHQGIDHPSASATTMILQQQGGALSRSTNSTTASSTTAAGGGGGGAKQQSVRSSRYQLSFTMLTSCPMTPELARQHGLEVGPHNGRNVVRQVATVSADCCIDISVDVLVLQRFFDFQQNISDLLEGANRDELFASVHHKLRQKTADKEGAEGGKGAPQRQDSWDFDGLQEELDDLRPLSEEEVERIATSPPSVPRPSAPGFSGGSPAKEIPSPYETLLSITGHVEKIMFEVSFPAARKPDRDIYGPLTQRLFDALAKANVVPPSSEGPGISSFSSGSEPLGRTLCLQGSSIDLSLPDGPVSELQCDGRMVLVALKDTEQGVYYKLLEANFEPLPDYGRGAETEHVFGVRSPTGPEPHPVDALEGDLFRAPALTVQWSDPTANGDRTTVPLPRNGVSPFSANAIDSTTEDKETELENAADVAVRLQVTSLRGRLTQDELLLLMFMVDEISECIIGAVSRRNTILQRRLEERKRLEEGFELMTKDDTVFITNESVSAAENGRTAMEMFFSALDYSVTPRPPPEARAAMAEGAATAAVDEETSTISVAIHVHSGTIKIRAPRLSEDGLAVADPLWLLYTPETQRATQRDWFFHTYVFETESTEIFLFNQTVGSTTNLLVNVRSDHVSLNERLPLLPHQQVHVQQPPDQCNTFVPPAVTEGNIPPWGQSVSLVQGYTYLHSRSENRASPLRKVLRLCLHRVTDVQAKAQDMKVDLKLDRVAVNHQPAHEGDHWLFVLINFVSDAPIATVEDDESLPETDVPVAPYQGKTHVTVEVIDTLLEYRPHGRKCMVVGLCPRATVDTGDLVSSHDAPTGKARVVVSLDKLSLYLHNYFMADLVSYDASQGHNSAFGATACGLAADLERLGFVEMGKLCGSDRTTRPTITLRMKESLEKPLIVEVSGLSADLTAASDSFDLFINDVLRHFSACGDWEHLPTPFQFVEFNGPQFLKVKPRPPPPQGPQVSVFVDDFPGLIAERLEETLEPEDLLSPDTRSPTADGSALQDLPATSTAIFHVGTAGEGRRTWKRATRPKPHAAFFASDGKQFKQSDDDDVVLVEYVERPKPVVKWLCDPCTGAPLPTVYTDRGGEGYFATQDQPQPGEFSLSSVFSAPDHFTLRNRTQQSTTDTAVAKPLQGLPPLVSVEILFSNCNVTVKFYGGDDFGPMVDGGDDLPDITRGMFIHPREYLGPDGRPKLRASRRQEEVIEGKFLGLKVQVDLFAEGQAHQAEGRQPAMQLLCSIKDFEVLDNVEVSPVRCAMCCTVPPEYRDAESDLFEMKWVTVMPRVSRGGQSQEKVCAKPEEEISIRVQPLWVSLHERTLHILKRFFVKEDIVAEYDRILTPEEEDAEGTNAAHTPASGGLFFNKFLIHPLDVSFSWYPEASINTGSLLQRDYTEFMHVTTVEGARMKLAGVLVHQSTLEALPLNLLEAVYPQLTPNILLLLCGLSPVRTVSEVAGAVRDVYLKPWDSLRKNKSLYSGIIRGLSSCGRRLTGEAFRLGSATSHMGHRLVHAAAEPVQPDAHKKPLLRGNQPVGVGDGLQRGLSAVATGVTGVTESVRVCIGEEGRAVTDLPLVLLVPVDGVMRGMTEIFLGLRNFFRPDSRAHEVRQFKPGHTPGLM